MDLVLKEEHIERLVAELNEDYPGFDFDWQTYCYGNLQQSRSTQTFLMVEGKNTFALIFMKTLNISQSKGSLILDKGEIQGLKMKRGWVISTLKLRTATGEYFKCLFSRNKRVDKYLPRHRDNLSRYHEIFEREFSDRGDLSKDPGSNRGVLRAFTGFLKTVLLFIVVALLFQLTESIILPVLASILLLAIDLYSSSFFKVRTLKKQDKAFLDELAVAERDFAQLSREEKLQAYRNMNEKPKTEVYQKLFYSKLIPLAHLLGDDDTAKTYLSLFPRRYSLEAEQEYLALVSILSMSREELKSRMESMKKSE